VTPWDFTFRVELRDRYKRLPDPAFANLPLIRLEGSPDRGTTGYRLDLPFQTANGTGSTVSGMSDVLLEVLRAVQRRPNFIWGGGARLLFPTASAPALGQGKYQVGPAGGFEWRFSRGTFSLLVLNLLSYAGDPGRSQVNELLIQPFLVFPLPDHWWLQSAPEIKRNWIAGTWFVPFSLEVGNRLSKRYAAAVQGTVPVVGSDQLVFELILKLRYYPPTRLATL
jgi:hypothetical protein